MKSRSSKDLGEAYVQGAYTLDEIAEVMGLSRERVRQIYVAAIRKMQAYLIDKKELREELKDSMRELYNQRAIRDDSCISGQVILRRER